MKVKILGIEAVNFTDKETKQPVSFARLYFSQPLAPDKGVGVTASSVNLPRSLQFSSQVGDEVEIYFNQNKKVEAILPISK